jgi:ComEC/Rec2-related protein
LRANASAPFALSLVSLLEVPPIYLVAIAILAGDALGVNRLAAPLWIAGSIAAAAVVLFMRRNAAAATGVALLAIAAAVSMPAREAVAPHYPPDSVRHFADGESVMLEGRINQASQQFPDREYVFVKVERAGASAAAVKPVSGNVRLTIVGAPVSIRLGDEVKVTGVLRFARNFGDPGEFDYEAYLAREGITTTMVLGATTHAQLAIIGHRDRFPGADFAAIRARIGAFIDANLAGERRAEMRALIIGDRGGIDEALRQRFALTGLAHMLVISGLHLGFVAAAAFSVVRLLMMFFPTLTALGYANKAAACIAALAACAYAAIAMPHVSTTRALVMVRAYALAVVADRARALLASLALAAIVICLAMPGSTADIGFQLSFASVLAIVLGMRRFAPWWCRRFFSHDSDHGLSLLPRIAVAIAGYVAVSFWALLGVAPLTAYHFNQFSTVGLIANSVVVPVMGLGGVVCGLAACAIGLFAPAVGAPVLVATGWSLAAGNVARRMVREMAGRVFQNLHADAARDRDGLRDAAALASASVRARSGGGRNASSPRAILSVAPRRVSCAAHRGARRGRRMVDARSMVRARIARRLSFGGRERCRGGALSRRARNAHRYRRDAAGRLRFRRARGRALSLGAEDHARELPRREPPRPRPLWRRVFHRAQFFARRILDDCRRQAGADLHGAARGSRGGKNSAEDR